MKIVGVYLRTLREAQGMTRPDLVRSTGVSEDSISRVESGDQDPRQSLMAKLMNGLGASADEVYWLQTEPRATLADAERLARARATFLKYPQSQQEIDADIAALQSIVRRMESDGKRTELRQLIKNLVGLFGNNDAVTPRAAHDK